MMSPFWEKICFTSNFHCVCPEIPAVLPSHWPKKARTSEWVFDLSDCHWFLLTLNVDDLQKKSWLGGNFPKYTSIFTLCLARNESLIPTTVGSWNWGRNYNSVLWRTEIWSSCVADMQLGKVKGGESKMCRSWMTCEKTFFKARPHSMTLPMNMFIFMYIYICIMKVYTYMIYLCRYSERSLNVNIYRSYSRWGTLMFPKTSLNTLCQGNMYPEQLKKRCLNKQW